MLTHTDGFYDSTNQGSEKPELFLKKSSTHSVSFGFIGFGLFGFFHLNKQLGSLLVDLAHQLSFDLVSPVF